MSMTDVDRELDPEDDTNIYDPDAEYGPKAPKEPEPLYRVYGGSRIAVGSAVGMAWQKRFEAASTAYQSIVEIWDEIMRYYNHSQTKNADTPRGQFKRGDSTENVIYSNLNIMLPAVYGKDPDVTCSSTDAEDEPFCNALQALLNTFLKRKDLLNAKPKIKKASGMGLLTNFGIFKLDFTKKDDSREMAQQEMGRITQELEKASTPQKVEELYGELQALEANMEVLLPSGPSLVNTLPHNLVIDPYAEMPDGTDAGWMIEKTYLATSYLNARFTEKADEDGDNAGSRVLKYKPTHKAAFQSGQGSRDDGLGMVLQAMGTNEVTGHTTDERAAYINMYYTECCVVWDKATRRVLLFQKDDWKWPIWVWDDPLKITRFFAHFIIGFGMSTGGTVNVGETAYILDQQDDINDINRQLSRIRRTIFDYFFYNSDVISSDEAEKFINALRGKIEDGKHLLGIKGGENGDISKMIQALAPPSVQFEAMFNKQPSMDAANRITNTNDALRGVQYKTNTNEASVQSYQESLRISVGAKVDVIEDVVADLAGALAELAIQNYDKPTVEGLIGKKLAEGWRQMGVPEFLATYNLQLVAGSMEKPNSAFKKKEAVQIAQAIGQFAQAAPGATLKVMLKVLEKAFTEVVIQPEDWQSIDDEITANSQKGVSTGAAPGAAGGQDAATQLEEAAKQLPEEVKQQVVQMKQAGKPDQEIAAFIMQKVKELGNGSAQREPAAA